ncbi:Aerobic glycerol-3-phosphate dehydrogenase [Pontiella desulfatans]|uniref:Aerobic glycerol-3-phosphate dehydrogenase n=1 Tax=Pontiella desulfatans TaxID=2750659 RepID=A0A6C2UBP6_PONDE|nr:FAD-dependent oxidoreductase [Pontiella desulfatans]VGO16706.1 Aerobic glycerol-3-phosphate dehydrogenase [Pontiella desulfatans]
MSELRTQCIEHAKRDIQDCLVIGAGINGAVAAAALAGKGAKVTVIDKADFASFTSQESSNLAWGGIKYLENYEFPLVWGLCKSRNQLMDAYPGQVREIRFFTSIAKGFRKPRVLIYLGALLYWFMGRCRTRPPRLLSVARIRKEAPRVNTAPLAGGLEYSDCYFVENDTRFAFSFIRKVLQKGCNAINYMELVSGEWKNGHWECALRDPISGEAFSLRAKTLVNAAGPYTDRINAMLRIDSPFKHIFSKGAHIIVRQITKTNHVLTFFASDGRLFFMIPMGNRTCIGTTDTRVDNEVAEPSNDDVEFLLQNANTLLKLDQPLTKNDVIAQRCGVRPLVVKKEANVGNSEWTALSRKHEIDVHPERHLCSIYGGKLTDCINVGEEVTEIIESFGVHMFQSLESWYGEPSIQKRNRFESECRKHQLDGEQIDRLWRRYGKEAFQCLEKIRFSPALAEKTMGGLLRAELHLMAEREMVVCLDDLLRRRTRLALTEHRASLRCDPGLAEAAKILFGKNAEAEIERYFGQPLRS